MDQSLVDLEIKIAHQELAIEQLQQVVFDQHTALTNLEKNLQLLKKKFEAVMNGEGEIGPANEKPPHY